LAVAMKLPVLAVAYNRLGCLNHAVLTVQKHRWSRAPLCGTCRERCSSNR
jgi:dethiobiotin synthetase